MTGINSGGIISYSYDANGNIVNKTIDDFTTNYTYNQANLLIAMVDFDYNFGTGYSALYQGETGDYMQTSVGYSSDKKVSDITVIYYK